jgi:UDP-N-acetylmuramoylalanine--D-glutamate ligase
LALSNILEIPKKIQKKSMEGFEAIEGRMQFLGEKKKILFFNDNNSTTPESTIINISLLKKKFPNKKIFLISGGADKKFEFKELSKNIEKKVEYAVFFNGAGSEKIINKFSPGYLKFQKTDYMKKAFEILLEKIDSSFEKKDSIIILSPGTSSFGAFKNEYDRNDQFVKLFKKY